jgi:hypothetical protein
MKKHFLNLLFLGALHLSMQAQDLVINGQLSLGSSLVGVTDNATAPSGGLDNNGYLRNPSDGETGKHKDGIAVSLGINADYYLKNGFGIFTGLHIAGKDFSIYNRDGGYWGKSTYSMAYLQIPIGITYLSPELVPQLKLYGRLGINLDMKIKEELKGGDGAHYWNLANNLTNNDPMRGRNADNEAKALFSPLQSGVLFSVGAEYGMSDKFRPFLGLTVNQGISNILNPSLKHNDVNQTPVIENLRITLSTVTLDLGIRF